MFYFRLIFSYRITPLPIESSILLKNIIHKNPVIKKMENYSAIHLRAVLFKSNLSKKIISSFSFHTRCYYALYVKNSIYFEKYMIDLIFHSIVCLISQSLNIDENYMCSNKKSILFLKTIRTAVKLLYLKLVKLLLRS